MMLFVMDTILYDTILWLLKGHSTLLSTSKFHWNPELPGTQYLDDVTLGGARPVNIKNSLPVTSSSWIKTVFSYKMTLGAEI